MKVFIVLAAFVAVASASSGYGMGSAGYGVAEPTGYGGRSIEGYGATLVPTGHSTQHRSEDNYGNYEFGYDESHAYGGSSRQESGYGGNVRGSYSLNDVDGRRRTVNYIADDSGFHADIQTNEPGVEPRDPADVSINKNGHNVAASGYAAQSYAAPVSMGYESGSIGRPIVSSGYGAY